MMASHHQPRVILHLVGLGPDETEAPESRYEALRIELEAYDEELSERPEIVVLNKGDLCEDVPGRRCPTRETVRSTCQPNPCLRRP